MLNAIIVTRLDKKIVFAGASLLIIIGIYFILLYQFQKIKHPFKELAGATFYSLGVFTGPMAGTEYMLSQEVVVIFLLFFLLAYINLQTISFYEKEEDVHDSMASFANYFGPQVLSKFLTLISALYFIILFLAHLVYEMEFQLLVLFFLMGLTSVSIILFNSFFRKEEKYRIYGDLVFLLPVLLLLSDSL